MTTAACNSCFPRSRRLVTFPGTHNSNAIKTNFPTLAQHQSLTFAEQLKVRRQLAAAL